MPFVLTGRSRVAATFEKRREAPCGRCLAETSQIVLTFRRSTELYYVEVAHDDLGRIAECDDCGTRFPVKAGEAERDEDRWADAFLDAHVFDIERADQSNAVEALMLGLGTAALVGIGVGLSMLSGTGIERGPALVAAAGIVVVPVLILVWLFQRLRERVGDAVFARAIRERLERLDARWKIRPVHLAERASIRRYPRLARHFSTPRYSYEARR